MITVRVRSVLAGGLVAAGMSAVGIGALAGPASAHDLTGGSAQATCEGQTVQVTWTFVSRNAGEHTIQSVSFDRSVSSSSHTATTVTAHTTEPGGTTVALTATAVFEDGFQAPHTVTTTIPDDICPPATTTTVAPTTTAPPTTTPPTTTPPTTTPVTTAPTTAPVTTPAPTVPDTVAAPAATPRAAAAVTALPTTGTSATVLIVAGLGAMLIGAIVLFTVRRTVID
jgi:LPXTG-motif cell wall-anchored protein